MCFQIIIPAVFDIPFFLQTPYDDSFVDPDRMSKIHDGIF